MSKLRQLGPYTMHSDPGHAWLAVPFEDVYLLGIGPDLSPYSYMSEDRKILYLEEDCDIFKFKKVWCTVAPNNGQLGARFIGGEEHTNEASFIRELEPLDWIGCLINYTKRLRAAVGGVYNTTSDAEHDPNYDY